MKTLLLAFFVLSALSTNATNYYFSTQPVNDICNNDEAQNSLTTRKTLTKIYAVFASPQPTNSILYKRGEKVYFSITILRSKTISNQIILGAYCKGTPQ